MRHSVSRRSFLQASALTGIAATGATVASSAARAVESGPNPAAAASGRTIEPKLLCNGTASLSKPSLDRSPLSFRLGLARTRTAAYPLNRMDFIMIDLEQPKGVSRHATGCYGDLTGRLLEFLSCAEGVDGQNDPRLDALFDRIYKDLLPTGKSSDLTTPPDPQMQANSTARLSCGLMRYHQLTGDPRALQAALAHGERLWSVRDNWRRVLKETECRTLFTWMSEFFTQLYAATQDQRWYEFCAIVRDTIGMCDKSCHAHFFMSTLRGLQQMAMLTGDPSWNEKPEANRRLIIDRKFEMPDGSTPECFPPNGRNEGCSISDWLMINLNAGLLGAPDAYEKAERIFWNGLSFNQWITGCFGHRPLTGNGYGVSGMEEAWWCCVHDAGMAMSEYARHAVTFRDGAVHVNLLVPGRFSVPLPGGASANVKIATAYPSRAEATIEAEGLPNGIPLKLRVPACVRSPEVQEAHADGKTTLTLRGQLGHRIEQCNPGVILTYGPLVLVPATGLAQPASLPNQLDGGVPAGYIPKMLPSSVPSIVLPEKPDAEGYVKLPLCPGDWALPEWSYFDEGPGSPTWVDGASVGVQLKFADGQVSPARFTPMCYNTSALVLQDTPVIFQGIA